MQFNHDNGDVTVDDVMVLLEVVEPEGAAADASTCGFTARAPTHETPLALYDPAGSTWFWVRMGRTRP